MKISIVIPTRDRCEFLEHCLATCTHSTDPDLEIVVSDNNSSDDTRGVVERNADPRVIYAHPGASVSMRQNFEFAMDHASGDYIIFIGDDDGIIPNGLTTLRRLLNRYQPDVALWRHLTYIWPRQQPAPTPGLLKFRYRDFCGPMHFIDPAQRLEAFFQARKVNYRDGANIYHGCVHRCVIDRVRQANGGPYFMGASPDINTAMSNLIACKSIAWFRNPVSIAGAGHKSTGWAMSGRTKINRQQVDLSSDFNKLMLADPNQPELSTQVRSIPAHTYANLIRACQAFDIDIARINHAAWRQVSIDDLRSYAPEDQAWPPLEAFFKDADPSYELQGLAPPPATEDASESSSNRSDQPTGVYAPPAKLNRGQAPSSALVDVQQVVRWIQGVVTSPYTPTPNTPLALIRQGRRLPGMWWNVRSLASTSA